VITDFIQKIKRYPYYSSFFGLNTQGKYTKFLTETDENFTTLKVDGQMWRTWRLN